MIFFETEIGKKIRDIEKNENLDAEERYRLIKAFIISEEESLNEDYKMVSDFESSLNVTEETIEEE